MTDAPTANDIPPPVLPDLEMIRLIGRGAYGQVWLARNRVTRQLVAVKVISQASTGDSERAARELAALMQYASDQGHRHENVVTVHHVGQTDNLLFYLMDPADDVSGRPASDAADYQPASLARRLEAGPAPLDDCQRWSRQLLAGLAHLHQQGLVHRDVKPANCLFVGGRLQLADIGLLTPSESTASLVGTLKYMPPDRRMDSRADVYAAGLVIYEMLSGLPADCFPRLGPETRPQCADPRFTALNRIVLRACQPQAAQRFADARAMLAALQDDPQASNRHRIGRRSAVVLGLVAIGTAMVWLLPDRSPEDPPRVDVNFITEPYEAEIFLDGRRLVNDAGEPYTTPCTVPNIESGLHQVVFKRPGAADQEIGPVDFSRQREVFVQWPEIGGP